MDDLEAMLADIAKSDESSSLSPLADPVFTGICDNVDTIDLGLESLVNAVLFDSGDPPIAKVLNVTPQRVTRGEGERTCRVDVEAVTEANEFILIEVQLASFKDMNKRSLLYTQKHLDTHSKKGELLQDVIKAIPRIIVVNIVDFTVRKSGGGFHQVVEWTYREPPHEVAADPGIAVHHLQLPEFRKIDPDYSKPLHCWLSALCLAHEREKLLEEVVMANPDLKAYYDDNPGFKQFVDRHGLVSGDPKIREEFQLWLDEEKQLAKEFLQYGKEKEARGRADTYLEIALKAFQKARPGEDLSAIAQSLSDDGFPPDIIQTAREQVESER